MKHANSLYTLEDEVFRKPPRRSRSRWWKWSILCILAGLFVYRSTRPTRRLSADPPPSFYDYNSRWSPGQRRTQERLAQAYWRVAVRRVQRYYSPGKPLPEAPPPQFRVAEEAKHLHADLTAARVHYWYRLRSVWNQQDAWVVSYGWNTDWVETTLNSLPQYMPQFASNVFQALMNFFNDIAQKISYS